MLYLDRIYTFEKRSLFLVKSIMFFQAAKHNVIYKNILLMRHLPDETFER